MPIWLLSAWRWVSSKWAPIAAGVAALLIALFKARRSGRMNERRNQELESIKARQRLEQRTREQQAKQDQRHVDELDQIDEEIDTGRRDHMDNNW